MSLIKKLNGEPVALAALVVILDGLIKFFNVGKSMNDHQLAETVKLIMSEYYFLKLEDLKLCFDGMKSGKYIEGGKLFDRLDGQIILSGLRLYNEERQEVFRITEQARIHELNNKQERYFVKIGENYLRESEELLEEVEEKELASDYSYSEAMRKKELVQAMVKGVKVSVEFSSKPEIGLIDYIKKKKPELKATLEDEKEKKERKRDKNVFMVEEINNNPNLSPLEKRNKIRGLYGLVALNQEEFELSEAVINKTKK